MATDKRFVHYSEKSKTSTLAPSDSSVAFISDTREILTHGEVYGGYLGTDDSINLGGSKITPVNLKIKVNNGVFIDYDPFNENLEFNVINGTCVNASSTTTSDADGVTRTLTFNHIDILSEDTEYSITDGTTANPGSQILDTINVTKQGHISGISFRDMTLVDIPWVATGGATTQPVYISATGPAAVTNISTQYGGTGVAGGFDNNYFVQGGGANIALKSIIPYCNGSITNNGTIILNRTSATTPTFTGTDTNNTIGGDLRPITVEGLKNWNGAWRYSNSTTNTFNSSITHVGEVVQGEWKATPVANDYIENPFISFVNDTPEAEGGGKIYLGGLLTRNRILSLLGLTTPMDWIGVSTTNPLGPTGATVGDYDDWKGGDIIMFGDRQYVLTHAPNTAANWTEIGSFVLKMDAFVPKYATVVENEQAEAIYNNFIFKYSTEPTLLSSITATSKGSTAFGTLNTISGDASFAINENNGITGNNDFASGSFNVIEGNNSFITGSHNTITGNNEVAFGYYNVSNTNTLFTIGKGTATTPDNALTLTRGGLLGIGVLNPLDALDTLGGITVRNREDQDYKAVLRMVAEDGLNYLYILPRQENVTYNVNTILNEKGGNVGIGTSTPAHKLDVTGGNIQVTRTALGDKYVCLADGTNKSYFGLDGQGVTYLYNDTNKAIYFATNKTARMYITGSGDVGIGTASPTEKLEVNGNVKAGRLLITKDTAVKHIEFSRASYNYISAPATGSIDLIVGDSISAVGTTAHITDTSITPGTTNTIDLGSSSYKWKNVYATKFTGNLEGNADTASHLNSNNATNLQGLSYHYLGGSTLNETVDASWSGYSTGTNYNSILRLLSHNAAQKYYIDLIFDVNNSGVYYRRVTNSVYGGLKLLAFTDSDITGNAATATKATLDGDGNTISSTYLKLSGGTLTGALTLKNDLYYNASKFGLDCANSDIVGVNSIYTDDSADNTAEGIRFYRDASHWDSLTASGGNLYFMPNDVLAGTAFSSAYKVYHSGNIPTWNQDTTGSALRLGDNSSTTSSDPGGLTWYNKDMTAGCVADANDGPTKAWWYILRNRHTNTANDYYTDVAIPFNDSSIYYKIVRNGSLAPSPYNKWVKVFDENNFTSGTGASNWCAGNDSRLSNSRPASDVYAWAKAATKPTYNWGEITNSGANNIAEGTSDVTDNTEIFTSYASNNGFADTNAQGVVYRRDAIHIYNYVKGKLDSVYHPKNGKMTRSGGTFNWQAILQYNSSNANPSYHVADCAIININSYSGWQPWIRGVDSENGSWAIGQYTNNFHIGRIVKSNTANSLTYNWEFGSTGNLTISGSYYANSDIRYKNVLENYNILAEDLALLPIFTYTWSNKEDNVKHLGTSAQSVEAIIPELVTENEDGFKSLDYATFGAVSSIALAKELVALKEEIKALKSELSELRNINK